MTPSSPDGRPSRLRIESLSEHTADLSSLAALLLIAGVLGLSGSGQGLLIGLGLLVGAVFTPATIGFVLGQLALLPTLGTTDTTLLVVTQLGLLVVLTEPARPSGRRQALGTTGIAFLGLGGIVVVTLPYGLSATGGILVSSVGVAVYIIYRVAMVRVEGVTAQTTGPEESTQVSAPTQAVEQSSPASNGDSAPMEQTPPTGSGESKE